MLPKMMRYSNELEPNLVKPHTLQRFRRQRPIDKKKSADYPKGGFSSF